MLWWVVVACCGRWWWRVVAYNNINNVSIAEWGKLNSSWCIVGVEKEWFQKSTSTHSGAAEKETLNIDVEGKKQ